MSVRLQSPCEGTTLREVIPVRQDGLQALALSLTKLEFQHSEVTYKRTCGHNSENSCTLVRMIMTVWLVEATVVNASPWISILDAEKHEDLQEPW